MPFLPQFIVGKRARVAASTLGWNGICAWSALTWRGSDSHKLAHSVYVGRTQPSGSRFFGRYEQA